MKHTPTPWKLEKHDHIWIDPLDNSGWMKKPYHGSIEYVPLHKFILLESSHDELLEANTAMEKCLNEIADYATLEEDWTEDLESVVDFAKQTLIKLGMRTLQKAIQKAEGEHD